MVVLMPDKPQGLLFLQDALNRTRDDPERQNIFDIAYEKLRKVEQTSKEHIITMPMFKIDSNIDAREIFSRVRTNNKVRQYVCALKKRLRDFI